MAAEERSVHHNHCQKMSELGPLFFYSRQHQQRMMSRSNPAVKANFEIRLCAGVHVHTNKLNSNEKGRSKRFCRPYQSQDKQHALSSSKTALDNLLIDYIYSKKTT